MSSMRALSRLSPLRSRLQSVASATNLLKSSSRTPICSSSKRIPCISRLPVECSSCLLTMLPLHSAVASARLQSVLSVDSQSWCLVPQGMSMPL